ncbi:MAG: sigma-54 dependent transcriptional regulator [Bacteroidia bacterium]|nr:sigma-54 dependent transcriptional regulator [Bacteroidia bacterium]
MTDSEKEILIVDDEDLICFVLANLFKVHGFRTRTASRGEEALAMVTDHAPSLVVMDIRMPGLSGFDVLVRVKQINPDIPVILMTALAGVRDAVEAMKAGAFDYVAKPFNNDEMMDVVRRALESASKVADASVSEEDTPLHPLFTAMGDSAALRKLARHAARVASLNAPLLIIGDIGTGKRMVARIIHEMSGRPGAFVTLDCTGADPALLRHDLYGPAEPSPGRGRLELAAGGTLLIDEIAEPPALFQEVFADVLRTGQYSRDGGEHMINHDARVIFTCTAPQGSALEDLNISPYLLDVIGANLLLMPTLKDRREDIPHLAAMFVSQAAEELDKRGKDISAEAMQVLETYEWPGNVHQLKSAIRRALLNAKSHITIEDLDLPVLPRIARSADEAAFQVTESPLKDQVRRHISEIERQVLLDTLRKTGWNKARASRMLKVTYKTILKKIQEYNLEKPQ